MLASVRHAYPDARIDWLVQDTFAPAISAHPALDEIIPFPRKHFGRWWTSATRIREFLSWMRNLRTQRYDLVLDCQGLGRSGLFTWATRAHRRVGARDAREFAWLGYNVRHVPAQGCSPPLHTVDRMLGLLEADGITVNRDMRLFVNPEDASWWSQYCTKHSISAERYAVLAPTSRWLSKRWPIGRWAELVSPLLMRGFEHVVLIGGPNEHEQVNPILPKGTNGTSPLVNLVDQTTIGQTMAVISQAGLVVANDSAPLHMAVGFDRPCVGLFGPTEPALVGPYQREDSVVRGFTARPGEVIDYKDPKLEDRLMRVISTTAVVRRIDHVLSQYEPASSLPQQMAKPTDANCPGGTT